ncbi:MAG TPA: alpha-amylase family glycosyl hydrolase [Kiritimatiellia bacterium]|nr:alpha-amylase family glycosyl hydrolase [Kiritimatiellia bacterium]
MNNWIAGGRIYQINLRSLAAREPRNAIEAAIEQPPVQSPIAYVMQNLSTLKRLGMTILHFMPPFPMGFEGRKGIGSPYAARQYDAVDPEYGTMEEFRQLIATAHRAGCSVIVGMVPNHTSRDHVWTRSNPDFYVKAADGTPAYDLDWSDTAKLDYRNPGLRAAMIDTYDFWLKLGTDGFRIDMAHFINDRSFWDEAIAALKARHPGKEILFLAECYGLDNSMDLFRRGFNASYDDGMYKILEKHYGVDENLNSVICPGPGADTDLFRLEGVAGAVKRLLGDYRAQTDNLPAPVYWARYTDNHDEGRGVYRFGEQAVRVFSTLFHLLPGSIPFMLTGQEFGAANRPSIHERIGPCDKGRRVCTGAGIRSCEGVEFEGNLFARGFDKRREWYEFFRTLMSLRSRCPVLVDGEISLREPAPDDYARRHILIFERRKARDIILCALNFGPEASEVPADLVQGRIIFGALDGSILPAFGFAVSLPG